MKTLEKISTLPWILLLFCKELILFLTPYQETYFTYSPAQSARKSVMRSWEHSKPTHTICGLVLWGIGLACLWMWCNWSDSPRECKLLGESVRFLFSL